LLAAADIPASSLPDLPASTTYVVLDREGGAVACALTMNNLFGTGRMIPGTGLLLAASPASVPPPLLAAAIAWNSNIHAFRAEVAGSGQASAPLAVAVGLDNALRGDTPMPVPAPEPGRANAIACSRYLPDSDRYCAWATDPRGFGLAVGSN
jgi:gamma-glutamyltranspeptidase/glutathione hydrolase